MVSLMLILYVITFICAAILALVLVVTATKKSENAKDYSADFKSFQRNFLFVYYIMTAADWMQGPYVFALYHDDYNFSQHDVAVLFVAGFGSSLVIGTFVGSMADTLGRRAAAELYAATYILSCITKHWNNYHVLMLGRLLGGVSTSLLYSAFDAWLACEHSSRGFDEKWLADTVSLQHFGNGFVAIMSGLLAQAAVAAFPLTKVTGDFHMGGFVMPFDMSMLCLIVGWVVIRASWSENYGDKASDAGASFADKSQAVVGSLKSAVNVLKADKKIVLVGAAQSLFEGSMYTFVFMWTPTLSPKALDSPPHGLVFASFMVSVMIGSQIFKLHNDHAISKQHKERAGNDILALYMFLGSCALAVVAIVLVTGLDASYIGITLIFLCFMLFEMCVGVYFPSIAYLKAEVVPENERATIYNFFRVGLNVVVLSVLLTDIGGATAFFICAVLLSCAGSSVYMILILQRKGYFTPNRTAVGGDVEASGEKRSLIK